MSSRNGNNSRSGNNSKNGNSLYTAPDNCNYTVSQVPDVKILSSLGVFPGTGVRKKKRFRFGGPVLVNLATREVALGKDIAEAILVEGDA